MAQSLWLFGSRLNGTKKSYSLYRVSTTDFKAINSVGTGQAIVLDEVLRSLIKFASSVSAALLPMPAGVNYTVPSKNHFRNGCFAL